MKDVTEATEADQRSRQQKTSRNAASTEPPSDRWLCRDDAAFGVAASAALRAVAQRESGGERHWDVACHRACRAEFHDHIVEWADGPEAPAGGPRRASQWCSTSGRRGASHAMRRRRFWRPRRRSMRRKGSSSSASPMRISRRIAVQFLQQYGITYPIGPDTSGAISISYGVPRCRRRFLSTVKGIVVDKFDGALTQNFLDQRVAKITEIVESAHRGARGGV